MMESLLHFVSILSLSMKFGDLMLRNDGFWVHNSRNFKVALDLLMVHLSKSISHGTIQPIEVCLMGGRRFIVWTIQ